MIIGGSDFIRFRKNSSENGRGTATTSGHNNSNNNRTSPTTTTQEDYLSTHTSALRWSGGLFFKDLKLCTLMYRFCFCILIRVFQHTRGNISIEKHEALHFYYYVYQWATDLRLALVFAIEYKYHDLLMVILSKRLDKRYFGCEQATDVSGPMPISRESFRALLAMLRSFGLKLIGRRPATFDPKVRIKRTDLIRMMMFVTTGLIIVRNLVSVTYETETNQVYQKKNDQEYWIAEFLQSELSSGSSASINTSSKIFANLSNDITSLNTNFRNTKDARINNNTTIYNMPIGNMTQSTSLSNSYRQSKVITWFKSFAVFSISNLIYCTVYGQLYGQIFLYVLITAATCDILTSGYHHDLECWSKTRSKIDKRVKIQQKAQQSSSDQSSTSAATLSSSSSSTSTKRMRQSSTGSGNKPAIGISVAIRRGPLLTTKLLIQIRDIMIVLRSSMSLMYLITYFGDIFRLIWMIYTLTTTQGGTRSVTAMDFTILVFNMFTTRIGHYLLHREVHHINQHLHDSRFIKRRLRTQFSTRSKHHNSNMDYETTMNKLTKKTINWSKGQNQQQYQQDANTMYISETEMMTIDRLAHDICNIGPTDWFEPDMINVLNGVIFAVTFVGTIQQLMSVS